MPKATTPPTTPSNPGRAVRAATANLSERISEAAQESASTSNEMARRSAAGLEAFSQASASTTQALQDLSREWLALAQDRMQRNMQLMETLSRCRSLPELFALQGDWASANLQLSLEGVRRIAEVSTRLSPFGNGEPGQHS